MAKISSGNSSLIATDSHCCAAIAIILYNLHVVLDTWMLCLLLVLCFNLCIVFLSLVHVNLIGFYRWVGKFYIFFYSVLDYVLVHVVDHVSESVKIKVFKNYNLSEKVLFITGHL